MKKIKAVYHNILSHLRELAASNRALAAELAHQRKHLTGIHEHIEYLAASERGHRQREGRPL